MSRARWLFWGGLLLGAIILLIWARGPLQIYASAILDRLKIREREAAKRLEDTKRQDAEAAHRQSKTNAEAAVAKANADRVAKKAQDIEWERRTLAKDLAERITNEERARRFRKRHGLSDPRDPSS